MTEVLDDWAIGAVVAVAAFDEVLQGVHHFLDLIHLLSKGVDMTLGQFLNVGAGSILVAPQSQQLFDIFYREPQVAGSTDELEPVNRFVGVFSVAGVGPLGGRHQAGLLVVSDHLGRYA